MSRQGNLAKIHIAKKDLGMSDDAYRAMLQTVAKVDSASKLDFHGQMKVLHHLAQKGWKPKRKKVGVKSRRQGKSLGDKIRALWIEMHNDGLIRDGSEDALRSYIKRMTKNRYAAAQFCDDNTAIRIIESLKQWRKRLERTNADEDIKQ